MKLFKRLIKVGFYSCFAAVIFAEAGLAQTAEAYNRKDRQVLLTLTVTNSQGMPIKGLQPDHFEILADKKSLKISSVSDQEEPASILFLVDISGSMSGGASHGNNLRLYIRSILNFLEQGNDENEYAVLSFNKEIHLEQSWTQDKRTMEQSLNNVSMQPAKGLTALFDACRQGLDLIKSGKHRKRVIILLSDGQENVSKDERFGKLKEQVRAEDALLFGISIVSSGAGFKTDRQGQDVLEELAAQTGGLAFFAKGPFDLDASFEVIGLLLRNQYVVRVQVAESANNKWHPIKVEIKLPPTAPREVKYPVVRYRAGYFDRVE